MTYPTPTANVVVESRNSSREFQRATKAIRRGTRRVATSTIKPSSRIARTAAASNPDETARRVAQLGQDDHQRHDGKILDDENAEHHAARQGPDPTLRLNRLQHDHRARQRDQSAEPPGRPPFPAERKSESEPQRDGGDDLNRRPAKGDGTNRLELAERQFEPKREQQQRHAELCQLLDVVHVLDREAAGKWTDEDTRQHVPHHQRLTEPLREEATRECGKQDQREVSDQGHAVAAYMGCVLPANDAPVAFGCGAHQALGWHSAGPTRVSPLTGSLAPAQRPVPPSESSVSLFRYCREEVATRHGS